MEKCCVFHMQAAIRKKWGQLFACSPDSPMIMWISHRLYFLCLVEEKKNFSFLHKGQKSFFLAGRIALG
mgnify:FL=1|jgi:hypothetical protein